jgi:hypothetical protein
MSLFLQGNFLLLDLLKKFNFTNKHITICFSSYYNRSSNIKSLDLKYLEAIEKILNFASVTNILQNMKIRISLMGRLANQPIGT